MGDEPWKRRSTNDVINISRDSSEWITKVGSDRKSRKNASLKNVEVLKYDTG